MGQSDLYLWDIRHELILRLTDDLYSDEDPWFDPSGRLVVFSSDRGNPEIEGGMDLFLIELSTRSIDRLTQDGFKNIRPFWIENSSSTITYLSDRSGVLNVWSFNLSQDQEKKYQMTNLQQHTHYHTGVYDHYPYHCSGRKIY